MEMLKNILVACSVLFVFAAAAYVLGLIGAIWRSVRDKTRIRWGDFNPLLMIDKGIRAGNVFGTVILSAAILAGGVYLAASYFAASTQIGDFFEADTYSEYYEATVFIKDKPVFCIVEVSRDGADGYLLSEIMLPYGRSQYIDEIYEPEDAPCNISLGEEWVDCEIILTGVATEASYNTLDSVVLATYGDFCGSKKTGNYHYIDCKNVKNIKKENMVYFENHFEADALGFELCGECANRY